MRLIALSTLLMLAALFASPTHAATDNPELMRLAAQDQQDRAEREGEWDDNARRRRVLELIATDAVVTPRDKLNAALILQHTPGAVCDGKLVSSNPEHYLLAHHYAKAAFDAGLTDAGVLVAVTIDRYLSFTEGRQRYGTSQLLDLSTGQMYLPTIDRTVTDAERAKYGVAPLATLLQQAPERDPPAP